MNQTLKIMFAATMVCVVLANCVGTTMAKRVRRESGESHWPPAANTHLARDYHALYGAGRNYLGYWFFNLAGVLGIVVCAFYSALAL